MNWNKKVDGGKLNQLFESGRGRKKLDYTRKDKEYIEAVRKKHFLLCLYKNFCQTYKRKAAKVGVDQQLRGARVLAGKFVFHFCNQIINVIIL